MKTTYDIPLSTAATWNGKVGYSDIVDKVISFLCDKSNSVNVLVPGCGRGRLICEIIRKLSEGKLPKKSAGCVDCVDTKNEELEIFKRVLLRDGFILQAKAENADCRVLKLKKGQMIVNLWNTSIQSFLSSEAKKGYDLIAPLLFFHYIPDCWTNVLFDLLGVLNENGIFLTDRIVGDGKRSELLMRALDANNAQLAISQDNNRYPFSFFSASLKPYEDDVKKEYEKDGAKTDDEQERRLKEFRGILRKNQSFFVRKLKERSSFWGSSIKATDNSILCAVVHGLFNDKETLTSLSFKPSFRSRHLSWSWGEVWSDIECPELVDDIIHDRLGFDFKVYFEATLFRGFEKSKIEELRRQAYVLSTEEALRQFASIPCVLTKPTIGDNYSIREAARFAHDVIPQCMIQTLLSCGILDSNSELDNMFLCFNPPNKKVALVQNLVYAVNLDNREDCSAADRFLANAVYHTIYLKRSLSSTLFAAGKCELIYRKSACIDENCLKMWSGARGIDLKPVDVACNETWTPDWMVAKKAESGRFMLHWALGGREQIADIKSLAADYQHILKGYRSTKEDQMVPLEAVPLELMDLDAIFFMPFLGYRNLDKEGNIAKADNSFLGLVLGIKKLTASALNEAIRIASFATQLAVRANDSQLALYWCLQSELASLKSAIGSIMSRNGSHNIGSHVLAALSHNIGTMPDDRVLYQYIQHRMDYIATATTEFPTWSSEGKLVNGLLRRFLSQRHLLDYIASSEGLHAFKFQDPNISEDAEQPNTIRLRIRRLDKLDAEGKPHEFIGYKGIEATANFDEDVAVAIPGGVIGEHAFFTILENVIRNAAKHGWAKTREKQKNNYLDIFIDFKRGDSNRTIEVDVYDGLSDVFAISKNKIVPKEKEELTQEEKATNDAIDGLEKVIMAHINREEKEGLQQLQGSLITEDEDALADYLSGKSDNLPEMYDSIKMFLRGEEKNEAGVQPFKRCQLLRDILVGTTDNPDKLGHRLWLPLHHSQQLKLAKQFIDESGALRKENWGLAEMKISAGYLNRRPISEIGGLDKTDPIITPTCEAGADGGAHLGYHFSIPVPREIAFVCDSNELNLRKISNTVIAEKIKELQAYGIYILQTPEDGKYVKPKTPEDQDWNFSYVVLPKFPEQKDPHLPFRVLAKDNTARSGMVPKATFYDNIIKAINDLPADQLAYTIKNNVYWTWVTYWNANPPQLKILTDGEDDKSNMGLISNYEIWEFVFKEMFRSVVGDILRRTTDDLILSDEVYCYILLLVAMPNSDKAINAELSPEEADRENDLRKKINDNSLTAQHFENLLIREQLQRRFTASLKASDKDLESSVLDFAVAHKLDASLKASLKKEWVVLDNDGHVVGLEIGEIKKHCKSFSTRVREATDPADWRKTADVFIDKQEGVRRTNGFGVLIDGLCSAYREADIMLRKYEERIVSLPEVWGQSSCNSKNSINDKLVSLCDDWGVALEYNNTQITPNTNGAPKANDSRSIAFMRHATDDRAFKPELMHYLEPLSGTQSYLSDLQRLPHIEFSQALITKMYETGLSKILIIDERVSKFLRTRPEEIKIFCRMGIWCVDETKIESGKNNLTDALKSYDRLIELDKSSIKEFIESERPPATTSNSENVFDILIIHQGLIDKWLPRAGTNSDVVERFIAKIKAKIPYVIITTGRGTPANIPDSARILPFAVLENTLFKKYPEKLVLVDTIMNILPIGEHK